MQSSKLLLVLSGQATVILAAGNRLLTGAEINVRLAYKATCANSYRVQFPTTGSTKAQYSDWAIAHSFLPPELKECGTTTAARLAQATAVATQL